MKPIASAGDRRRFAPATIARLDSPERRLRHARWVAASDDEHAVSTARLGPWKSNAYDTRLAAMLSALPAPVCAPIRCSSATSAPYSLCEIPTNTPVRDRASDGAGAPASSSASQVSSSSRRCCGSISSASRGEIPKKYGSNRSTPSRKPPHRVVALPGAAGSAS